MITLRQGGVLRCGCDRALWISLDDQEVRLPIPRSGCGGSELVVSADERFAAMYVYSGQSEQGWELFGLSPLRHLGGLPYVPGEGDAPRFSPDGEWLVMFVSREPTIEGTGECAEDVLGAEGTGTVIVDWATVYVQAIPDGRVLQQPVGTPVSIGSNVEVIEEWRPYGVVRFDGETLMLDLPFGGAVRVDLPPTGAVTTQPA